MRPALRLLAPVADAAPGDQPLDRGQDLPLGPAGSGEDLEDDLPLTVPVVRAGDTPWPMSGTTTWVPAALLLAAAGECSCDACCADLARRKARRQLTAV